MLTQTQIRQEITDKIVEGLRNNVIAWRKPWRSIPDPVRSPTNFVTKRPYSGINVLSLNLAGQINHYPTSLWASYQQFRNAGCQVKKGEKATTIVLYKPIKKVETKEDGEKVEKSFPILKTWSVFNVAQVEGKAAEKYQTLPATTGTGFGDVDRTEFDKAVAATGADIRYGYEHAAYHRPPGDYIVMPDEDRFESFPAFAETLLHECCHWTEWRTGWQGSYAEGELRAEMGACFLANALGVPNSTDLTNHTAYIQSWLKALENDPKFVFRCAASASKGVDFILNFSRPKAEAESEELVEAA